MRSPFIVALTDFLRGLALKAGHSGWGANAMLQTWWGRALVASRWSRGLYSVLKCACFCYLGLELALTCGEETAGALKDGDGKPQLDGEGHLRKGDVVGLHVMRREKGFGEAYGKNRTGEWEYVEYRADGSYITPPRKSFACAECHVRAGGERDFIYRGRLPEKGAK